MKQIIGVLLVVLSGCGAGGAATIVRTTHAWGELTLSGPYLERVAHAIVLMATHCDGPFAVVDQEAETGFTEAPRPDQTRVQFVCPARVATGRYRRARRHTTGGEGSTSNVLVTPGSVTSGSVVPAPIAPTPPTATATLTSTPAPLASAVVTESTTPAAPTNSPALALSAPTPSQRSTPPSAATPSPTDPSEVAPPH